MALSLSAKLLGFVLISLMAIAGLITVAVEAVTVDRSSRKTLISISDIWLQHLVKLTRQPQINLALKAFFLISTGYYLYHRAVRIYKLAQPGAELYDFRWFYVASKLIWEGLNPYQPDIFVSHFSTLTTPDNVVPFVYPPNTIPLIFPLGYFSPAQASLLWIGANLLAIGCLLGGAIQLLEARATRLQIVCVVAGLLIYGTTYNVRVGNISGILAAVLVWFVVLAKQNKSIAAGILLGITTLKPPLSVLFLVYFLVKKRYRLVLTAMATSAILVVAGLLITHNFSLDFLRLYQMDYALWSQHTFNNPFTSSGRIDLGVMGPRLFNGNPGLAKAVSTGLILLPMLVVFRYLYQRQKRVAASTIALSEIALITCLNLLISYAQPVNSVVLILPFVFLLNCLVRAIEQDCLSWKRLALWGGLGCLMVHSNFLYYLIDPSWKPTTVMGLASLVNTLYDSLPNLALLGLTVCLLSLAQLNLEQADSLGTDPAVSPLKGISEVGSEIHEF